MITLDPLPISVYVCTGVQCTVVHRAVQNSPVFTSVTGSVAQSTSGATSQVARDNNFDRNIDVSPPHPCLSVTNICWKKIKLCLNWLKASV